MLNNCHLSNLILEQAKKYQDREVLRYRDYELDSWVPVSWNDFAAVVSTVSRALLALGVKVQENIGVFSQNKPECLYTDFGAYGVRVVTIPFYATSSSAQVAYMINDAAVRFVFAGEQQQYDIAFSVLSLCPTLEKIIIFDKTVKKNPADHLSIYFDEFLELAKGQDFEAEVAERMRAANYEDTANILYTSGTTGNSKGVILTYNMYRKGFEINDAVLNITEDDLSLCFLPFTHVFERAWSCLCLAEGARLAVNLRPMDVQRSMQEVHPTCMCSVPRFWEKVYQAVLDQMDKGSAIQRRLIKSALEVGGRLWCDYTSKGLKPPMGLRMKYELYNRTIIKILRTKLGLEKPNFFPTAGAVVSPEVERFVHAAGINMVVGYGLTESMATVSCDRNDQPITMGSVGRVLDGIEIKIGENNEILLRGETILPAYYRKDKETREAIEPDGWFHTGDAGYIKDGELFLTERIKDLFKTSNGKYIAPQVIETKLAIDRFIDQVVIIADKRKFVSALIIPSYAVLEAYGKEQGWQFSNREELCQCPEAIALIGSRVETLQQDLAHYEMVKRFILLPRPFTMENGELTNTLKIKRRVIYEHYAKEIDQIYLDVEKEQRT
ncbi:long-chain-fatty-acid-CoA ligase [gut metagenome]|uniref:Long-chain-fatty-acid-CoA ligase n=1 Tax=gut metagenome TaxID=749906 RepID=J9FNF4_9ZZZZ